MDEKGKRTLLIVAVGCLTAGLVLCCVLVGLGLGGTGWFLSNFPFRRDTRPRPALIFSPAELPAATVGRPYDAAISISQNVTPAGKFFLSDGNQLPPGLALGEKIEADSVHITGTPEKAGTYPFTVNVWCYGTSVNGQTGSKEYTITVNP